MRKRKKSYYYDRYTGKVAKATEHASYPISRPRRYLFLFTGYHLVGETNKRVRDLIDADNRRLKSNGA